MVRPPQVILENLPRRRDLLRDNISPTNDTSSDAAGVNIFPDEDTSHLTK
jgi:hypothetical protein